MKLCLAIFAFCLSGVFGICTHDETKSLIDQIRTKLWLVEQLVTKESEMCKEKEALAKCPTTPSPSTETTTTTTEQTTTKKTTITTTTESTTTSAKRKEQRFVKVAVYEHNVTVSSSVKKNVTRQEALSSMMVNLEVMKKRTEEASQQGAKLIVLPEYGIFGLSLVGLKKTDVVPYLEYMPDPKQVSWNPCENPGRFSDIDVQIFLSCLAKNNSIYVVANYGDIQPCSPNIDPGCPSTGRFQYNTNIVYDNKGHFIARYHKLNLYFEFHFDKPNQVDITTFETPFGTFGVFTCFDILFHDPAIELVEKRGIRNIVFPTAWKDSFPFFYSIQFHSAFAVGWGINFLTANLHIPRSRFRGSGIFTPNGTAAYYYDGSNEGRLLVADMPILKKSSTTQKPPIVSDWGLNSERYDLLDHVNTTLHRDNYNVVRLRNLSGNVEVCHNQLCCRLSYTRSNVKDFFIFGAFDGLHTRHYTIYLQVCTLLRCRDSNFESCRKHHTNSATYFTGVEMKGNFSTPYIYPEILLSKNGTLVLPSPEKWQFNNGVLRIPATDEGALVSANLYSRIYSRDTSAGTDN